LELGLDLQQRAAAVRLELEHVRPVPTEQPFQPGAAIRAGGEKAHGPNEILVVILFCELVLKRVRLVGSRGKQQNARSRVVAAPGKQLARKLRFLRLAGQQRLEALELIQNDQIGLEQANARLCE